MKSRNTLIASIYARRLFCGVYIVLASMASYNIHGTSDVVRNMLTRDACRLLQFCLDDTLKQAQIERSKICSLERDCKSKVNSALSEHSSLFDIQVRVNALDKPLMVKNLKWSSSLDLLRISQVNQLMLLLLDHIVRLIHFLLS